MEDGAAFLVERVLPEVPYRHWVMSFPRRLRLALALDATLMARVLAITLRAIFAWQRRQARRLGWRRSRTGAVTFVQRFSSALRLNVHFHCLVPDGVFAGEPNAGAEPSFLVLPPPDDQDVEGINRTIARKVLLLLRRLDPSEVGVDLDALAHTYSAALQPPRAGLRAPAHRARCSNLEGFSLHADVHLPAEDRRRLARICRYGLRPPLALGRLELLPSGDLAYRLKRPAHDGATHRIMSPLEFVGALASLVPPPRVHLTRYHGVFAPHARDRGRITAAVPIPAEFAPEPTVTAQESPSTADTPPAPERTPHTSAYRRSWAELLQRVFAIDIFRCDRCGSRRRIIAAITRPEVAQQILHHLRMDCPPMPIRAPPGTRSGDQNVAAP
jgi:hypothetical protein